MDTTYDVTEGPMTRRELDRLQRWLREPPRPEMHLTPGGATEQVIKRLQREHDSVRASVIDGRLKSLSGRATRDFTRASLKVSVREEFERSR